MTRRKAREELPRTNASVSSIRLLMRLQPTDIQVELKNSHRCRAWVGSGQRTPVLILCPAQMPLRQCVISLYVIYKYLTISKSGCPMRNFSLPKSSVSPVQQPSAKPYDFSTMSRALHATTTNSNPAPSTLSRLNPLNYMPTDLSQSRAQNQKIQLPVERTISSIPRGDADAYWEYPSPQQMYNAMLRKGYDDTPEDAVESMVAVHNFLNEGAWREIEGWEEIFSRGLGYGWQTCRMGNDGFDKKSSKDAGLKPKLLRFQGRPTEPTPKARVLQFMGKIYPSKFGYGNYICYILSLAQRLTNSL